MGEYENVLGPLILAIFINTYLSGIVGFQYLAYQYNKFTDSYALKTLVLSLWLIDIFQIVATVYMSWLYCVTNYINPSALSTVALWTYTVIPLCNALSGAISHSFLTNRVWKATKSKSVIGFSGVLSFAAFALAAVSGVYGTSQHVSMITSLSSATLYRRLVLAWLCIQASVDIMFSAVLVFSEHHSRPSSRADSLPWISQVMASFARKGVYNAIFSTAALVIFLASSKTTIYLVFVLPLGRLYSITVLTTLLSRDIPSSLIDSQSMNDVSKDFQFALIETRTRNRHESFSLIQIKTEREIIVDNGVTDDANKARLSTSRRGSDLERRADDNQLDKIPESVVEAHQWTLSNLVYMSGEIRKKKVELRLYTPKNSAERQALKQALFGLGTAIAISVKGRGDL